MNSIKNMTSTILKDFLAKDSAVKLPNNKTSRKRNPVKDSAHYVARKEMKRKIDAELEKLLTPNIPRFTRRCN